MQRFDCHYRAGFRFRVGTSDLERRSITTISVHRLKSFGYLRESAKYKYFSLKSFNPCKVVQWQVILSLPELLHLFPVLFLV